MTTKVKKLKALLGLDGTSDPELLKQLNAAHDCMNGNPAFSNSPVDMPTFKAGIDKLTVLVTDAEDGGKKAISAKKRQRAELVKQYTLLGHYVEAVSNDDPAVFHTSGFILAPTTRALPQPLHPASFEWIDRGPLTGQVVVKPRTLPKAWVTPIGALRPTFQTACPGVNKPQVRSRVPAPALLKKSCLPKSWCAAARY